MIGGIKVGFLSRWTKECDEQHLYGPQYGLGPTQEGAFTNETHQYFSAEAGVQLGRRSEFSSFLYLFLYKRTVGCRVIFREIIQHGPQFAHLLQNILCTASGAHVKVTVVLLLPS